MYSNETVAASTNEYRNEVFTTKELKVESIPERNTDKVSLKCMVKIGLW
jgi:hypothetical protein